MSDFSKLADFMFDSCKDAKRKRDEWNRSNPPDKEIECFTEDGISYTVGLWLREDGGIYYSEKKKSGYDYQGLILLSDPLVRGICALLLHKQ